MAFAPPRFESAALFAQMPMYLNVSEAALYLGVSDKTVQRLRAQGRIRAARIGARRIMFPRSELDRFVGVQLATMR